MHFDYTYQKLNVSVNEMMNKVLTFQLQNHYKHLTIKKLIDACICAAVQKTLQI